MPHPIIPPIQNLAALAAAALLLGCSDPVGSDTPYVVTPVSSTTLAGTPGWALTDTLVIEVRDAEGNPVPGAKVTWSLPNGGKLTVQLADADDRMTGTADSHGRNFAVWTLGLDEGVQVVRAVSGLVGIPAEFEAEATVLHARQVSVGGGYACAILTDQRLVCWGYNGNGRLGTGDSAGFVTSIPVSPSGLPEALEVHATEDGLTCARDLSGDVWCWGRNWSGEAGPAAAQPFQSTPVRVAGAEGAVSLSIGMGWYASACAVLGVGGAKCWGYNEGGQLGTGDTVSSATPRLVVGSANFVSVASGGYRTCALDPDGEAWCWGDARSGELSPLPAAVYSTPQQPVPGFRYSSVAVGAFAVCGIQVTGRSSCFGRDWGSFGHLPISNLKPGDSPVRPDIDEDLARIVSDYWNGFYARSRFGRGYAWGETGCCDAFTLPPAMITPTFRIEEISASNAEYCVISETGGVYCGRTNWWVWWGNREETLAGIPDAVIP
jgi:hypothetical protein